MNNLIIQCLNKIRQNNPLIHNITNYVVMNNTANALLAIGASPVMAHAAEEMEDIVNIASALVINIGTLSNNWVDSMIIAGKSAHKKGIPVIFDPVGAGASRYRTDVSKKIVEICCPNIIRGNASEIMTLADAAVSTKGVDSSAASNDAVESAKLLAEKYKAVVVISGKIDFITDGKQVVSICNGSELMSKITGMGCTATAIVAACAAVERDSLAAAVAGMAFMGISGEITAKTAKGPGTFQAEFLDTLYSLNEKDISQYLKLEINA